jgi:hypothetical protein
VTDYIVRSDADAIRVLVGWQSGPFDEPRIRFDGWPRAVVNTTEPMDVFAQSRTIAAVQEWSERLFAWVKHGVRNRSHLNIHDKHRARPRVDVATDRRRLTFDFSKPFNEAVQASLNRSSAMPNLRPMGWAEAFRDVSREKLPSLSSGQTLCAILAAIVVGGITLTNTTNFKTSAKLALSEHIEENRHQETIKQIDSVILADAQAGGTTTLAKSAREKAAIKIADEQVQHTRILSSLIEGDPLVRFVANEVERIRPALWDVAPLTGTININGFELSAKTARAVAKGTRANNKRGIGVWKTTSQIS